jgi:hypothetical protein
MRHLYVAKDKPATVFTKGPMSVYLIQQLSNRHAGVVHFARNGNYRTHIQIFSLHAFDVQQATAACLFDITSTAIKRPNTSAGFRAKNFN